MKTEYTVTISDDYTPPSGPLNDSQYVNMVMNRAAQSYQAQYKTANTQQGIEAACAAYNADLPPMPELESKPQE